MKPRALLFFLLILLIVEHKLYAQSPFRMAFNHLTRDAGLSNNNIFRIYRDSRGFVWLGTMNGLNRFDGINVKVYKPYNSKILGTKVNSIIEDKAGNLWIGSDKGLSTYLRKADDFETHLSPSKTEFHAHPITFDEKGLLWLIVNGTKKDGLYTYNTINHIYTFVTSDIFTQISTNQTVNYQKVKAIYCSLKEGYGLKKLSFENNKLTKTETFFDGKNGLPLIQNLTEYVLVENDSTVWVTGEVGIYKLNPIRRSFKLFNQIEQKKIPVYLTQMTPYKNYLLIGSGNGFFIFDRKKEVFVQHIAYSKLDLNGLGFSWNETPYIDSSGNLFLAQLGYGLDFTNINRNIAEHWAKIDELSRYGINNSHIAITKKNGDFIYAKSQDKGTVILNYDGKIIDYLDNFSPQFTDQQGRTWLTDGRVYLLDNPKTKQRKTITFRELSGKSGWQTFSIETEKGEYLLAGDFGLYQYSEKANTLLPIEDVNKQKLSIITPIYYDKSSEQVFFSSNWWGRQFILKKQGNRWRITKELKIERSVFSYMPSQKKNKIWLGTSNGLVLFDTQTYNYKAITEKDGLPDNNVTDIYEEPNGDYWLVTNRGISYYSKSKNEYRNFTTKDGAYSQEYDWGNVFKIPGDRYVFGGTDGISVFRKDNIQAQNIRPKVQITRLSINEKPFRTKTYIGETTKLELEPSQNTFSLDIVGIEYGSPDRVKIHYQLEGVDNQWIKASNPAIARYVNVVEGTYKFRVKATDEDEKMSSEERIITVIIHAPYYRTAWFRALLVVSLILLGFLFYRLRIKQIREEAKKKEEIRRLRAEAEINALRSQMNPHFIFNCLNTIDSYILLNKTDDASEFLNKFSKLIRRILENSREEFNTILKEIDTVELYIKLEQERIYPKFSYDISIDEQFGNEEYYIPTMLIQPFVENAILHGLRHKKDGFGELYLNLKKVSDQIVIHIIDNGIGREASKKINSSKSIGRKSVGIYVTEERIEKLNEIYSQKANFKITDINENNDKGTIVEIKLPLLTLKDLKI